MHGERLQAGAEDGEARPQLAVGGADAGGAVDDTLLTGSGGPPAERLRTDRSGNGATLARSFQILHRVFRNLAGALAPVPATHQDGGAHVLAPFESVVALAPTEHAPSELVVSGWRRRCSRGNGHKRGLLMQSDDGKALASARALAQ